MLSVRFVKTFGWSLLIAAGLAAPQAHAQVDLGLVDLNSAPEAALASLPGMSPELSQAIQKARPFASVLELQPLLAKAGLDSAKANALFARAFVHINLNSATAEEILMIPGAGKKMAHEFEEYRPWKSFAQFDKEIGKYVSKADVARLRSYCFIPLNANSATSKDLSSIPNLTPELEKALTAARPFKSKAELDAALTKAAGASEAKRVGRYLVI